MATLLMNKGVANLISKNERIYRKSIAWRIFDVEKIQDVCALPENTYLQKKAKEYIMAGNLLGWGFGVFFKG